MSFQITIVSPFRQWSTIRINFGRSASLPLAFSSYIRSQPAALNASVWRDRFWSWLVDRCRRNPSVANFHKRDLGYTTNCSWCRDNRASIRVWVLLRSVTRDASLRLSLGPSIYPPYDRVMIGSASYHSPIIPRSFGRACILGQKRAKMSPYDRVMIRSYPCTSAGHFSWGKTGLK